jgi:protoporphyrinogen oxidase
MTTGFYLLDNGFVCNRVTEQKNLSPVTMEEGTTVLSFEITCREKDDLWKKSDRELCDLVLADCRKVPKLANNISRVTDFIVKRAPNVYECYYKQFDLHAEVAISFVQDINNAVTIGRRGLFLQGDMHQSVEMGLVMGDLIASNGATKTKLKFREETNRYSQQYVGYLDNN